MVASADLFLELSAAPSGVFFQQAVLSAERDATGSALERILQLDLVRERVCIAVCAVCAVCARDRCLAGDGGGVVPLQGGYAILVFYFVSSNRYQLQCFGSVLCCPLL